MSERESKRETEPMNHREITLADGRYMIFYTFEGSDPLTSEGDRVPKSGSADPVLDAKPTADAADGSGVRREDTNV